MFWFKQWWLQIVHFLVADLFCIVGSRVSTQTLCGQTPEVKSGFAQRSVGNRQSFAFASS
jgi:hypothetical protein